MQRKTELVLRLLRGKALDAVSRENQVPAHELERWQRIFLEQGAASAHGRSRRMLPDGPVVHVRRCEDHHPGFGGPISVPGIVIRAGS